MKQHSLLNEMAHSVTAKWLWTLNPHDMTSLIISKYVRNVLILKLYQCSIAHQEECLTQDEMKDPSFICELLDLGTYKFVPSVLCLA